jgi:hypothetical protein
MQQGQKMFAFTLRKEADIQRTFVVPTQKTLNWFLENNYFDLVELPTVVPYERMTPDLVDSFERLLEVKSGKNTYLHTVDVKTTHVDNALKRLSRVGLKVNKKFFDWLMSSNDMLLTYREADVSNRDSLKECANYFAQRSILGIADVFYNVNEFYLPMFYD